MRCRGVWFLSLFLIAALFGASPAFSQEQFESDSAPVLLSDPEDSEDVAQVLADEFQFDLNSSAARDYLQALTEDVDGDDVIRNMRFYDPRGVLTKKGFVTIRADSVLFKPKPFEPDKLAVEIHRRGGSTPSPMAFSPEKDGTGLAGKTILLDNGHFPNVAGSLDPWARTAGRFTEYTAGVGAVSEGMLTFGAVQILGKLLEDAGAKVFVTRPVQPTAAFPLSRDPAFDAETEVRRWYGDNAPALLKWKRVIAYFDNRSASSSSQTRIDAFNLYEKFDLLQRSRLAEKIQPDAMISIHLDGHGKSVRGFTNVDRVSAYLPGGILPGAVEDPKKVLSWLRRFTELHTAGRSLGLAASISQGCQDSLRLDSLTRGRGLAGDWTRNGWVLMDPANAVFGRSNLVVLRRAPGIIVLIEGLIRNNNKEHLLLLNNDFLAQAWKPYFAPHMYPTRVKEYAEGIFQGLQNHYN
jgi:N-acetylmuramoyl-L-alanine amidase